MVSAIMIAGFVVYLLVVLWIGVQGHRKWMSLHAFEKVNTWEQVLSAPVSLYGIWLLLAFPGFIYASGLKGLWIAIGLVIGAFVCLGIVRKRLRSSTISVGASSLPDYFERHFRDSSGMLKNIVALVVLVFSTVLIACGLLAAGKLLVSVFGMNLDAALGVSAIILLFFYLLPRAKIGKLQGIIVFLLVIVIPAMIMIKVGGVAPLLHRIAEINPDLLHITKSVDYNFQDKYYWLTESATFSPVMIMSLLAWGLGYFGQPRLLTHLMQTWGKADMKAGWTMGIACVITLGAVGLSGLFAIALFAKPLPDPESLLFLLLQSIFTPFVAGLLLAVMFAVIVDLIRSQCILIFTTMAKDIFRNRGERWGCHGGVLLVIAVALLLAYNTSSVFFLFSYAWAGFGASLGPAVLLSLYWRQVSGIGVLVGIMVGGMAVFLWQSVFAFHVFALGPGFVISLLATMIVSLITKRRIDVKGQDVDGVIQ